MAVGRGGWLGRVAAFCVLAGLSLDLAGGRWAAYISTPVPGVFLADLLWGIGCLAAIRLVALRALPRPTLIASGLAVAYLVVRMATSIGGAQASLLVRDVAPFAYLALVPLAAVALSTVSTRTLLWILRIAPLVMLAGLAAQLVWQPFGGVGRLLGGAELSVMGFPGRSDVAGVVLAIGVLAWGRFPQLTRAPGMPYLALMRAIQVGLVIAVVLAPSQAGQIVAAVAVVWAVLREVVPITAHRAAVWGIVGVVLLAALSAVLAMAAIVATHQVTVAVRMPDPNGKTNADGRQPAMDGRMRQTWDTGSLPDFLGTTGARFSTYTMVLRGAVDDGTWLAGRGLGDPGRLIGVCGLTVEEFQYAPGVNKCAVDDGSGPMPLREPHNWMLSLLLYQGVIGIAAMVALLLAYWWRPPPDPAFTLSALPAALYIGAASFGVVLSSPFGILPIATFTAFAISRRLRSADTDKVALSAL